MLNSFWWGKNKDDKQGIRWLNWDKFYENKVLGGIGFIKLNDFNLALIGKQAWRIHTRPDLLVSKIFKCRYFSKSSFLHAEAGPNPGYVWRSILPAQELIRSGTRRTIGDGCDTSVFSDPWLPSKLRPIPESHDHENLIGIRVCNLLEQDTLA